MAFVPENALEAVLMKAPKDPAARPEFYRLLLESDLIAIGRLDPSAPGDEARGQRMSLSSMPYNGQPHHPIFSSLTRFRTFITQETGYLQMKGRALFEATRGASFILNPGAEYGKELLPGEIASLLDPNAKTVAFNKPTKVLIGQPSVYPEALVKALSDAFAARADVIAAHLVQIAYEGASEPHPLIGVETTGEWQPVSAEIGRVLQVVAPGMLVDAIRIDRSNPDETLANALLKVPPFYSRK